MMSRDSSSRSDRAQHDNRMRASKSECDKNERAVIAATVTANPKKKLCFGGAGNYEGGFSWKNVV